MKVLVEMVGEEDEIKGAIKYAQNDLEVCQITDDHATLDLLIDLYSTYHKTVHFGEGLMVPCDPDECGAIAFLKWIKEEI